MSRLQMSNFFGKIHFDTKTGSMENFDYFGIEMLYFH